MVNIIVNVTCETIYALQHVYYPHSCHTQETWQ